MRKLLSIFLAAGMLLSFAGSTTVIADNEISPFPHEAENVSVQTGKYYLDGDVTKPYFEVTDTDYSFVCDDVDAFARLVFSQKDYDEILASGQNAAYSYEDTIELDKENIKKIANCQYKLIVFEIDGKSNYMLSKVDNDGKAFGAGAGYDPSSKTLTYFQGREFKYVES